MKIKKDVMQYKGVDLHRIKRVMDRIGADTHKAYKANAVFRRSSREGKIE